MPSMRGRAPLLAVAASALVTAGCSAAQPPEITFFADGHTVDAQPMNYCDVQVKDCTQHSGKVPLKARPGMPVQISVPGDVADTPWQVILEYGDPANPHYDGKFFAPGKQHAFTASAPGGARLLTVEVQQIGAAYAADQSGQPLLDEAGNPQLVARGIWSAAITP